MSTLMLRRRRVCNEASVFVNVTCIHIHTDTMNDNEPNNGVAGESNSSRDAINVAGDGCVVCVCVCVCVCEWGGAGKDGVPGSAQSWMPQHHPHSHRIQYIGP
jgi:hypothetical protein